MTQNNKLLQYQFHNWRNDPDFSETELPITSFDEIVGGAPIQQIREQKIGGKIQLILKKQMPNHVVEQLSTCPGHNFKNEPLT